MEQQVCVDIILSGNEDLEGGCAENDHHRVLLGKPVVISAVSVDDAEEEEEEFTKEKRKKAAASSAKKPPRPPQTQRAFSLDAADQKLIKELALIKRARIERMRGLLLQKKASKASSSSSYSTLFAMIFTVLVFIVVLFQGMSCQISCGTFQGSPPCRPVEANENGLIYVHQELTPSAHDSV